MKKLEDVIAIIPDLSRADLDRWIHDALVEARQDAGSASLTDTQFARVRLICTLRYDMDIEEETLPVVLDLLDQLHETRQRLYSMCQAVLAQDENVKTAVLEMLSQAKRKDRN